MNGRSGGGGGIAIIIVTILAAAGLIVSYILAPNLFKILLWVAIALVIVVIIITVLIIFAANKAGEVKDEKTAVGGDSEDLTEEQNKILSDARSELMELRRVIVKIPVVDIRASANEVCGQIDRIIQTLKVKPEKINDTRQCLNYYIPTIRDVLTHFEDLNKKGLLSDEMQDKTRSFLGDVSSALIRQYNNLFEKDKLDMEVDMEAMSIAIRRDGLI